MNTEEINNIITEISKLKNQGFVLSCKVDSERILSNFEIIDEQTKKGCYTLPRSYAFIKTLQYAVNESLYNKDVNVFIPLFTTIETIKRKLGQDYEKRREIISKVKNIKQNLNEDPP